MMIMLFLLTGCENHELENRSFPLAMGLDYRAGEYEACFNFPKLAEVSNENANSNDITVTTARGRNFQELQYNYEQNSAKQIDFSHCKALVLSENLLQNEEKLENVLAYLSHQNLIARNTYLFTTGMDMKELFALDEGVDKPLGTYLEDMLTGNDDYNKNRIMTLGKLYDELENEQEIMYIPVLEQEDATPIIADAYLIKYGEVESRVSLELARISLLIQDKLDGFPFEDSEGRQWKLSETKVSYQGEVEDDHIHMRIGFVCQAFLENGKPQDYQDAEDMKQVLKTELKDYFMSAVREGCRLGFDITNGYGKVMRYCQNPEEYEDELTIELTIEPTIVNKK